MKLLLTVLLLFQTNVDCRKCYYCDGLQDCQQLRQHIKCYDPNDGCITIISSKGVTSRGCSVPERKDDPCNGEDVVGIWIKCYHCLDDLCNQHKPNVTNSATNRFNYRYLSIFSVIFTIF